MGVHPQKLKKKKVNKRYISHICVADTHRSDCRHRSWKEDLKTSRKIRKKFAQFVSITVNDNSSRRLGLEASMTTTTTTTRSLDDLTHRPSSRALAGRVCSFEKPTQDFRDESYDDVGRIVWPRENPGSSLSLSFSLDDTRQKRCGQKKQEGRATKSGHTRKIALIAQRRRYPPTCLSFSLSHSLSFPSHACRRFSSLRLAEQERSRPVIAD